MNHLAPNMRVFYNNWQLLLVCVNVYGLVCLRKKCHSHSLFQLICYCPSSTSFFDEGKKIGKIRTLNWFSPLSASVPFNFP